MDTLEVVNLPMRAPYFYPDFSGLVPTLECFEVCAQGWDYFFVNSLKQYLVTGEGSPFEN